MTTTKDKTAFHIIDIYEIRVNLKLKFHIMMNACIEISYLSIFFNYTLFQQKQKQKKKQKNKNPFTLKKLHKNLTKSI